MLAAGIAVAALPAARAADETQPTPTPAPAAAPNADQPAARPERRGRWMDPAEQLKHLTEYLTLTADQQAKILPILKDRQTKIQALMGDDSLSREDRRAKMMELGKASQDQIRAQLTPDQQQKFDAMPRPGFGRGPRGEGAGGEPPPPPPPPANTPPPPPPPGGGA